MKLTNATITYLRRHTGWVPKKQIVHKARGVGYNHQQINDMFTALENTAHIGMRWNPQERRVEYIYYKPRRSDARRQKILNEAF